MSDKDNTITEIKNSIKNILNEYSPIDLPSQEPDESWTREEWQKRITENSDSAFNWFPNKELFFNEEIVSLSKGFMVAPVGLRGGKGIAAEVKRFNSFENLKETIKKLAKEKDMFLYMTFKQEVVDYSNVDMFHLSDEERAKLPKKTDYVWRGAFIERDKTCC
jgi:hypothetical protein